MAHPLETSARQTLFLVKDAPIFQKIDWPAGWQVQTFAGPELQAAVKVAQGKNQRMLLVVAEEDYLDTLQILKAAGAQGRRLRHGVVLIAADGTTLLQEKTLHQDVLDIILDKEFKKATEFHLLRSVRQLLRNEDRTNQRVSQKTLEHLNQTFISLSAERNAEKLLASIVLKGKELANAEGGSLYMIAEADGDFFFKLRIRDHEHDEDVTIQHLSAKVQENSVCGYVALTAKILNIPDVASLRPLTLPQFNKSIDHHSGTPPTSLLTIPLKNSRNEIIGVLQLSDKQTQSEDGVAGKVFDAEDESLLSSFATQAAICLENIDLYGDIQKLFEGFVKASISAIESRDPSTGGHSERVAKMCVALARATTEVDLGIYRSVKFREEEIRELEYAALLHDFGKIGVREEVLCKAKKLYGYQLDGIKDRIRICKAAAKIDFMEKQLKGADKKVILREYEQRLAEIDAYWEIVIAANEPTILKRESIETLERIRQEHLLLPDGSHVAVLTEEEYQALSVTKGSLTDSERLEVESHVRHTYQFLKMIPWTKDFRHLTEIAYCHHEKLDGTGYPRSLSAHEIPLQSKIMTIADIYDALTAADRWYKEAVPTQKALDILQLEVSLGKLDPVLFELFLEKKIYELTLPKDVSQVA